MNDGGAAFPGNVGRIHFHPGMSLRDYFAGMALEGLCAKPGFDEETHKNLAEISYAYSDAMIKERSKTDE